MASQHPDIEKVLFTQEDIAGIVSRLGEEITRDYAGKDLVLTLSRTGTHSDLFGK